MCIYFEVKINDTCRTTQYRAVLLLNTACDKGETFCEVVGRKFVAEWTSGLDTDMPAVSAAFFDLYENVSEITCSREMLENILVKRGYN